MGTSGWNRDSLLLVAFRLVLLSVCHRLLFVWFCCLFVCLSESSLSLLRILCEISPARVSLLVLSSQCPLLIIALFASPQNDPYTPFTFFPVITTSDKSSRSFLAFPSLLLFSPPFPSPSLCLCLQHLPDYITFLDENTVNQSMITHVVTGFTDAAPAIRLATIKAMPNLATKLSASNMRTMVRP